MLASKRHTPTPRWQTRSPFSASISMPSGPAAPPESWIATPVLDTIAVGHDRQPPDLLRAGDGDVAVLLRGGERDAVRTRHVGRQPVERAVRAQPVDASGRIGDAGLPLVGEVEVAVRGEVQIVEALEALAERGLEDRLELARLRVEREQSLLVVGDESAPVLVELEAVGPAVVLHDEFPFLLAARCGRCVRTGMSTIQRLPSRSNDGPSRKHSTSAPWRLGSDHAVRLFLRNFAGIEVKTSALIFSSGWNGLNISNSVMSDE